VNQGDSRSLTDMRARRRPASALISTPGPGAFQAGHAGSIPVFCSWFRRSSPGEIADFIVDPLGPLSRCTRCWPTSRSTASARLRPVHSRAWHRPCVTRRARPQKVCRSQDWADVDNRARRRMKIAQWAPRSAGDEEWECRSLPATPSHLVPNLITATSGRGGDMTNHPSQPAPRPDVTPGPARLGGRGHR
jgi:hypothetical protein